MTVEDINKKLLDNFGKDQYGNQKFRIVWSNDQLETRKGTFEKWVNGERVSVEENVIRTVPKYAYFDSRFVLERICPSENPELLTPLSYEPIYVFQDKNGEPLPLNYEVARIYANTIESLARAKPMTWKQELDLEAEEFEKSKKHYRNLLNAMGRSELLQKFQLDEAVAVPSNYNPVQE